MKKITMFFLITVFLLGYSSLAGSQVDYASKVKESMNLLQQKLTAFGAPKLEGGILSFGTTEINGNFDIVDEVVDKEGGTATVFIKKDDGSFERIATTIINEGRRAVGTKLADASPAMAPIKAGNAYYGPADILGRKYETGYAPIKDASGQVIGIYYVGYRL